MDRRHAAFLLASSLIAIGFSACTSSDSGGKPLALKISPNHRFLITADGEPFFWLGDTGWLLHKLNREQTERYVNDRRDKGFNVIQTSVLHNLNVRNAYGHAAVSDGDVAQPAVTKGSNPNDSAQYDYWDHVDYLIDLAASRDMYVAMVPLWGSNVKSGRVSRQQAEAYAKFLGKRYAGRSNVIWVNGGDAAGSDSSDIWDIIGSTLRRYAPKHLITFHPFGRTRSSQWFHRAAWIDFNMVQSGHRTYEQDPNHIGPDVWRYIAADYALTPAKPVLDGEPSYEDIPCGLHNWHLEKYAHLRPSRYDSAAPQPRWQACDVRRYAYWSVFAGGCGFTYGHCSVMQMLLPADSLHAAYGATTPWSEALNAEGASQLQHLKDLMLSRPYLERVPDTLMVANQGTRYDHIEATRGNDYAFCYTYNGREIVVNAHAINDELEPAASWFNPRNGEVHSAKAARRDSLLTYTPPSTEVKNGNDWVLMLDF